MICVIDRIIGAVGKHVIAQHALAGAYKYIGIDEAVDGGVIISALEIIEPGFLDYVVAIALFSGHFETPGGEPPSGYSPGSAGWNCTRRGCPPPGLLCVKFSHLRLFSQAKNRHTVSTLSIASARISLIVVSPVQISMIASSNKIQSVSIYPTP